MDIFCNVLWMADGGAGAGAGAGGAAAPAAADGGTSGGPDEGQAQELPHLQPRRKAKENPLASVQYGRQPVEQQEVTQAPAQEKASFADLIKGEYKQDYEQHMKSTLAERLKGRDADRQKAEQMEPILAALAHKYGKDAQDLAGIAQAVQDDNSLFEDEANEMGIPVERVREIMKISQEPVSLETPIGEEEDSHLGDFIPDEDASEPAEAASFTLLKEQLIEVLATLTPREEKVLKLRFGIEDGRTRTLEEVGKEFNVTRERIRQIEAKALRKLRHPSRSKKLKDFLN